MNFKSLPFALLFSCAAAYAGNVSTAPINTDVPDEPPAAAVVSKDLTEPEFNSLGFGELQQHDLNQDGLLDHSEYRTWMFNQIDRAHKGFFTALDAVRYYTGFDKAPKIPPNGKPLRFSFKYLDTDKNQIVTRKEYVAFAVALTRAADANRNGKVTRAEFNALLKKMFKIEDVDKNNGISLAEYLELVPVAQGQAINPVSKAAPKAKTAAKKVPSGKKAK